MKLLAEIEDHHSGQRKIVAEIGHNDVDALKRASETDFQAFVSELADILR